MSNVGVLVFCKPSFNGVMGAKDKRGGVANHCMGTLILPNIMIGFKCMGRLMLMNQAIAHIGLYAHANSG